MSYGWRAEVLFEDGDGFAVLKRIKSKSPRLPVITFSGYDEPSYLARAFAWGAAGYVLKRETPSRLIDSVRQVSRGESAWSKDELKRIRGGVASDPSVRLSPREGEVLKQISHGLTNKEIAMVLEISYETVKEHVQHILRKLGVSDRTQAAVWAVRKQLG